MPHRPPHERASLAERSPGGTPRASARPRPPRHDLHAEEPRVEPGRERGAGKGAGPVDEAAPDDMVMVEAIPADKAWIGIRWALWTVAIMVAAVMLVNAVVDPRGVIGWRIFPDVTASGRLVREKVWLLDQLDEPPATLLLGSSRGRNFDPEHITELTGRSAFNGSFSAGRITHGYGLAAYTQELWGEQMPDLLWLVDIESFTEGMVNPEVMSVPEVRRQYSRVDIVRSRTAGIAQLADFRMLPESRFAVARWRWGRNQPDDVIPWWQTQRGTPKNFRGDGFIRRPERASRSLASNLEPQMNRFASATYNDGFRRLSFTPRRYIRLGAELAGANGARVILVMTPMHPAGQERLQGTTYPGRRRDAWEFLQAVAADHDHVEAVDFSDVESFNGDPDEFFDGVHLKVPNTRAMLTELHRRGLLGGEGR